ncbi:hypothetical protein FRB96_006560 [Tulasnella sp. 330]|nr:hypothetical protein FRB96_006560 [Tulasnella sp. 330]
MPPPKLLSAEKRRAFLEKEAAKLTARDEWLAQMDLPPKDRLSIRKMALKHKVDHVGLGRLIQGQPTMGEFNTKKQLLTPAEEATVVALLLEQGNRAFAFNHKLLVGAVQAILDAKKVCVELGRAWVYRFFKRHPELGTYRATGLDQPRLNGLNPTSANQYWDTVEELYTLHQSPPENIFGMDEVGINQGISPRQIVIAGKGKRVQHQAKNAEKENITVLETICADRTTLKPTVIFKGTYIMAKWGEDNPNDASIAVSGRGYTDGEIGVAYMHDFNEQTKEKAGHARFLFVDGHRSHCTLEALDFAAANNIALVSYPPHTTHALQGLDVACFGSLKTYWGQEKTDVENRKRQRITKENFLRIYSRARSRSLTPQTIASAFRATGLVPFNRNILTDAQMAPAKANAQHADFAVVLPTPARAIVSAHRKYLEQEERSDDGDGNDSPAVPISPIDLRPVLRNTSAAFLVSQDSSSPTKRLPAAVLNTVPSSFEPTYSMTNHPHRGGRTLTYHEMERRVRMMEVKLQKAKDVIAKQRAVNAGANAQLVLRDLHLEQLQQENFELKKPKKSSTRRKLMSTKMARHLTGEAFREALQLMAEEDVVKAAQKKANEMERDRSKLRKEWRAQEHEMRKAAQQEALAAWEEEKAEATRRGKKRMPAKPKVTLLYPRARTPDDLKALKKCRGGQKKVEECADDESSESGSESSEWE